MSNDSSEPRSRIKLNQRLFKRRRGDAHPQGFGGPLRVVLNVLLIFIISQVVAIFLVGLGMRLANKPLSSLDNSAGLQFLYVFLAEGLAVGLVLLIVRHRKIGLSSIGLGRKPHWRDLLRAIIGFGIFYVLLIAASIILTLIFPNFDKGTQDVGFNHLNGTAASLIAFVALVILPPLGEEPLVRGYLYSGLRSRLKFVPALIITSLLFGAAHLQTGAGTEVLWAAAANTFLLSVVLVYLREKSGALYAGMLVHMFNNAIAFSVHFHVHLF
ncbi:CPBP family intramembrane metalloprotease [Candidatus Saccharibacteria bacterium]|jgi:membrane protease YdiL (CAAX protease family)|nr:CPBP family intramembrane metalloprotease [Candidatus Saccharibacteria bacterium]